MATTGGGLSGLANWQWLFLLEGLPSVALGLLTFLVVDDSPAQARWLTERERAYVLDDLGQERRDAAERKHNFVDALRLRAVWLLTVVYFCLVER